MIQTSLTIGQNLHGFTIVSIEPLEELNGVGIWARHEQTGAEVFHLYTDDEENLFAFAFATPPSDSTGVAHILEHSVLCGSHQYPLKDTFVVLAQGSLQTFLNAMTFPDKTVYPASSTNRQDYFNLMAVYGDAVFHPLLEEWTFMQEGHRIEIPATIEKGEPHTNGAMANRSAPLIRTGVVYNEMKGNYSSAESIAADWVFRSVLQGTPYGFDSGGDPDEIPRLSWEELRAFHRRYYSPANCRIFLYGNIPTEDQLAFLEERFFSNATDSFPFENGVAPGKRGGLFPRAPRWGEPRHIAVPYPAASPDAKSIVLLSWLAGDSTDIEETLGLAALTEVLLGHDGSPLARALVESHLGEDLAPGTGLETDLRETVFAAGLRGVAPNREKDVEALILSTLHDLVERGIPPQEIEAALFSLEFSNKELRRAGGPFSLVLMRRSLRGWLHGTSPWETLQFRRPFEQLKHRIAQNPRYFEELITRYLLDNPHRALVSVYPEVGLSQRKAEAEARELKALYERLSEEERRELLQKSEFVRQKQSEGDDPALLGRIPHLRRTDISLKVERVERSVGSLGAIPLVAHSLYTNGITYGDLAFPVDVVGKEDYALLPFLARCIPALGLPGESYAQVSSRMARVVGGFSAFLHSSSAAPGAARAVAISPGIFDLVGRDWIVFRFKTLHERFEAALPLVLDLIRAADFSDHRRLKDLLVEYRNDLISSLIQSGHSYAISAAGRYASRARYVEDLWYGIPQIGYVQTLVRDDIEKVAAKLSALRDTLVASAGLLVHLTSEDSYRERAEALLAQHLQGFSAPRPQKELFSQEVWGEAGASLASEPSQSPQRLEIFLVPPLQVGFVAQAFPAAPFASPEHSAELVLAHHVSTGPLWEKIRMQGGAYGAFAFPDGLEPVFVLATYRDPQVHRSIQSIRAVLEQASQEKLPEEYLEKIIIGAYAKETRPKTNPEKAMADFLRFLTGITERQREQKLQFLVNCTAEALAQRARELYRAYEQAPLALLAGEEVARSLEKEYRRPAIPVSI
ncbi:MAG TPA: insulinase family protein [Termitinemataceae bacterium]|nr:insulinase family protein [Termitinemataceae bacterium]HOM23483.1 insulinase family protein [Termitinemataceae bacterium]HPQ00003.1 insulinase family protein [Termitinemataceae bacterium]